MNWAVSWLALLLVGLGVGSVVYALSRRRDAPLTAKHVDDLPARLDGRKLYVISEGAYLMQASMVCPDGCGATINLNLMPDDQPCWTLKIGPGGRPTLRPSVWQHDGCGAHFFLRDGRVVWCD